MKRLALCSLLAACAAAPAPTETAAPAPLVGVDGSQDQADRSCNVVLRDLLRPVSGQPWQGTIEISQEAAAEGLVPSLLYQPAGDSTWHELAGTPSHATATPGFARFDITLPLDPVPADVQLVPFVRMPQGGRLFDHNRNPGDLDNYDLAGPDYAIWDAPSVCVPPSGPQRATLVFASDFTQHRDGVLSPGGEMTISYDVSRLPTCRYSQNGHAAWDITAHMRFEPAGELRDASVRDTAPVIPVPPDARQVVLWFEATDATGCHAWDSNYGANYTFDAATPPQWVGNAGNLLTRDESDPCAGATPASSGMTFDTWARQRATVTNLCFEVYQPGLTDHDDPNLWQNLDVSIHWWGDGSTTPATVTPVSFDRRVGNNARYAFSWRQIDPFRSFHCPDVPTTTSSDGQYVQGRIDYYVVVNGYELRPEPGAAYAAMFSDYATDPWRQQNCP